MAVRESNDLFVGRLAEFDVLRARLDEVRAGQPRVVLLEGPPGIGKTALIERFLQEESDLRVLRGSGDPWEASIAYGVVDQVTRQADISLARLAASRERELPVDGPAGVGAELLELLSELEQKGPVVLVVDDAHWADVDSLRALLFALRRLVSERVLALLAVRPEDETRVPEGLRRLARSRTGTTVRVGPLEPAEVRAMAAASGMIEFSLRAAQQLHAHTSGNPYHIGALLAELPTEQWHRWQPVLPAPRAFAVATRQRLEACRPSTRRLVEAAAVLGVRARLSTAAPLAEVDEPLAAVEEAHFAKLLDLRDETGMRELAFSHPLVRAAVYEQLGPARRNRLHLAAAALLDDSAALRHRVAAAAPPDPELASDLEAFAVREAAAGAWASAASALVEASRVGPTGTQCQQRLLRAVDAMVEAGDVVEAATFVPEIVGFPAGAMRDAVLGHLAVVGGRSAEASELLGTAWDQSDPAEDREVAAVVAHRMAQHCLGRLNADDVVEWARRAVTLAELGEPVHSEAKAVHGLGLGFQGRVCEGLAVVEAVLAGVAEPSPLSLMVRTVRGWLRLAADDIAAARAELAEVTSAALGAGSTPVEVWAHALLARTGYWMGAWDEAALDAERAVALAADCGQEWLRPLVHWAAVAVPAARGDWRTAEDHVRSASARGGDYELMLVTAGLARAQLAAAQGDHDAVLRGLEPVLDIGRRGARDELGFLPWVDLYGEALVGAGRVDEADAFLAPYEQLAADRRRQSAMGGLARVRGRIEAARGHLDTAEDAFQGGLEHLRPLPLPLESALLNLAYGQALRRHGQRRAAASRLQAAHERLEALDARPYLERCERELLACGLTPAERRTFDPSRLTPQELAVARLVAEGLSNRRVAAELFVSVKTVQFHLTHIYAKLGVSSRAELVARLRTAGPLLEQRGVVDPAVAPHDGRQRS